MPDTEDPQSTYLRECLRQSEISFNTFIAELTAKKEVTKEMRYQIMVTKNEFKAGQNHQVRQFKQSMRDLKKIKSTNPDSLKKPTFHEMEELFKRSFESNLNFNESTSKDHLHRMQKRN